MLQQRLIVGLVLLAVVFTAPTPGKAGDGRSASQQKTADSRSLPGRADKVLEKALRKTPPLSAPVEVRRPVDDMLVQYGQMVMSYRLPMGYGPITIEIDYLGNISGNDKLPNDIGQIARDVFAKIGAFFTFRTLPEATASKGSSGVVLPQLLRDRGTPPKPTFRLVGGIVGAEQVVVKGGDRRLDAAFGGGMTSTNGGVTNDHSRTLTAITIALTLEAPNSLDVQGASAKYRIYVEQTESNNGVELYMGGNGFGLGSRLKITQDSSDSLYDTVAMNLVHITGVALKLPYFQCDEEFRYDGALEDRVRQDFGKLTNMQLETELQRFMVVAGFHISRQFGPLQPTDRAVLIVEMQHRKLPVDRAGMVELCMQFWRGVGLDYHDGANRMARIYAENDLLAAQRAEQETIQQAELSVDPREFGFAPGTTIIVIDLSRVGRPDALERISATFRRCRNCGEVRWHQQKPLVGINTAMKESEVQFLISSTRFPFDYVWSHVQSPRLLVIPAARQEAPVSIR
jgi:hypothetical protein